MVNIWCKPNGNNKRSNVPYINGANIGAVSFEFASQIPKLFRAPCAKGQIIDNTIAVIVDHKITTNGTNLLPLKKFNACGNLL